MDIIQTALLQNTLVCLPTGLGKTLIAAVVMYNFTRWFPEVSTGTTHRNEWMQQLRQAVTGQTLSDCVLEQNVMLGQLHFNLVMIGLQYKDNNIYLESYCTESFLPNLHSRQSFEYRGALRLMPYPYGASALAMHLGYSSGLRRAHRTRRRLNRR